MKGKELFLDWLGRPNDRELDQRLNSSEQELGVIHQIQTEPPSANIKNGDFLKPKADLAKMALAKKLGVPAQPFWPEGRPYAVASTHDIDRILSTVQRFKRSKNLRELIHDTFTALSEKKWAENPFFNFDFVLNTAQELHIKLGLYVLQEKRRYLKSLLALEPQHALGVYRLDQIRPQLQRFSESGHEIGIHASFDSFSSPSELRKELEPLREIADIRGVRNHYLNFDSKLSPEAQIENELEYDSTMGFNLQNGFRCGTALPFRYHGLLELPFSVMDSALWAQAQTPAERRLIVDQIFAQTRAVSGLLVSNFHLHFLNPEAYPERVELWRHIIETAKADGAWIATPAEISKIWKKRAQAGFRATAKTPAP